MVCLHNCDDLLVASSRVLATKVCHTRDECEAWIRRKVNELALSKFVDCCYKVKPTETCETCKTLSGLKYEPNYQEMMNSFLSCTRHKHMYQEYEFVWCVPES